MCLRLPSGLGGVVEGQIRHFLDGVVEVDVGDDWVVVSAGHGKELVLQDYQAIEVPGGEVSVLVVGAEGAGFEFVSIGYVEDAEQVRAEFVRVDDAGNEVTTFHDEADTFPSGAGEAGGDDGAEKVGLGYGALDDVVVGMESVRVEEFVGVKGVAAEQAGVMGREIGVYGGAEEAGADVVGQAEIAEEGVAEGGLARARDAGEKDDEGLCRSGRSEKG